jgi:hypothetical protein
LSDDKYKDNIMSSSHSATIVCLLALCTYSRAFVSPHDVVSICRHRCLADVASGLADVGFGDCFEECIEASMSMIESQQSADKTNVGPRPEANDAVTDDAGIERKRNGAAPSVSWSRVFPRGAGSGSASKYLRIGRGGYDLDQAGVADSDEQKIAVDRRRVGSSDRSSSSLTGSRLGNSAKSYLRVGKKSAEKVEA